MRPIRCVALFVFVSLSLLACAGGGTGTGRKPYPPRIKAPVATQRNDKPVVHPEPVSVRSAGSLYRKGERLFSMKKYEESAQVYLDYVSSRSRDERLVDNAYFKTALSWFNLGRFRDADYYFNKIVTDYPQSETYVDSLINGAICRFYLNDLAPAKKQFDQAEKLVSSPGQRAYILYYIGMIDKKNGRFQSGVENFIASEKLAQSNALVKNSRQKIGALMDNFLAEENLLALAKKHKGSWAGDYAIDVLRRRYKKSGNGAGMAALLGMKRSWSKQSDASVYAGKVDYDKVKGNPDFMPAHPKIGAALPTTGSSGAISAGKEIIKGIQLASNEFHSLLDERGISLEIVDTSADPVKAEQVMMKMAIDPATLALLGPLYSPSFERGSKISADYALPVFSPSATMEGVTAKSPFMFRNALTAGWLAKKLAQFAVERLSLKRFAIIYPDDQAGREATALFRREVTDIGGEIVSAEPYETEQNDFSVQIKKMGGMRDGAMRRHVLELAHSYPATEPDILNKMLSGKRAGFRSRVQIESYGALPLGKKNFRPKLEFDYDAVYVIGDPEKTGLIMGQLEFYNIKNVVKLAGRSAGEKDFARIGEKYVNGVIFLDSFFAGLDNINVSNFVNKYKNAFRKEPTHLSAQAYDAMKILLSAVAHGARSRKELREYLAELKFFEGVTGTMSMSPSGDMQMELIALTYSGRKKRVVTDEEIDRISARISADRQEKEPIEND